MATNQEIDAIIKKATNDGYNTLTNEEAEALIEWKAEVKKATEEHEAALAAQQANEKALIAIAELAAQAADADLKEHLAKVEEEYKEAMNG